MGSNTELQEETEHTQEHQLDFLERSLLPIQKHNFYEVYMVVNVKRNSNEKCSPYKMLLSTT